MSKRVWLIFGSYGPEWLYPTLDRLKAQECGIGATFTVEDDDALAELVEEWEEYLGEYDDMRLYLITTSDTGKLIGRFLGDGRERPPWLGWSMDEGAMDVDE